MGGSQQVHHTGLDCCLWPGGLDGLWQAFEPVAHDDQNVGQAPVGELRGDTDPVFGAFSVGVADPHPQDVFVAVNVDAHSQVHGPVGYVAVSDLDHQRVDEHHRIHRVQGSGPPRFEFFSNPVGHPRYQVVGHVDAVDLFEVGLNIANGHAPGIQSDDPLVEPVQAGLALSNDLRLEAAVTIPGHLQVHGPESVCNPLGVAPLREFPDPIPAASPLS